MLLALAVATGRAAPDPTWQQLSSKRGDLDLLNKPYHWDAPRVDVWLNNGTGPRPAADGASKTTRYDLTPLHDGQRVLANPHKGWQHHYPDNHIDKNRIARDGRERPVEFALKADVRDSQGYYRLASVK